MTAEANGAVTVSKSQYARIKGVSQAAVSHWIRDGRIGGAALHGSGRRARIVVSIADRQLAERLDPGQQMGNGKALGLSAPNRPMLAILPRDQVSDAGYEAGQLLRRLLLELPQELAEQCAQMSDAAEVAELLEHAIEGKIHEASQAALAVHSCAGDQANR